MPVRVGEPLPDIRGESPQGPVKLADFRGLKSIVLWAYSKDGTSG
ncbi:MAG: hypothetical protein ACR2KS_09985 [Candidatus Eremiobacter antarcticus]